MTLLKQSAFKGDLAEAKRLVSEGTDPNGELQHGFTPLHWAVQENHIRIAKFLIDQGAYVNANRSEPHCSVVGTPLHIAAFMGHKELCELLIAKGASANAASSIRLNVISGSTPLHEAARGGHPNTAKLLIANDANANAKGKEGHTPLHLAKNKAVAEVLIENGAFELKGQREFDPIVLCSL
ncbi:MAG: ankyrin repeat domain-containing protein [Planctomycetota bacterium]